MHSYLVNFVYLIEVKICVPDVFKPLTDSVLSNSIFVHMTEISIFFIVIFAIFLPYRRCSIRNWERKQTSFTSAHLTRSVVSSCPSSITLIRCWLINLTQLLKKHLRTYVLYVCVSIGTCVRLYPRSCRVMFQILTPTEGQKSRM